jgi:lysozyme family protein
MAQTNFNACLQLTLSFEGGFVDNKFDAGGATNKGITRKTLSAYRQRPVSRAELLSLSADEIKAIYHLLFWQPIRGDDLPLGVDAAVFDYAVNSGPRAAIKSLQRALTLSPTGLCDDALLRAACAVHSQTLIADLCAQRRSFMERIKHFSVFKKGWLTRVKRIEMAASEMHP